MTKVIEFLKNEEGISAIEYGLIAGLIGLAAVAGFTALGNQVNSSFTAVGTQLGSATGS